MTRRFIRIQMALLLFGVTFGLVEASVVVYLRALLDPVREQVRVDPGDFEIFPLLRPDVLEAKDPGLLRALRIELAREAATIFMLGAMALAAARNAREWFSAFAIAFGIWDIFYYVFLKVFLDWPASLLTWDLLFLLPVPWVGPVLSPTIVSVSMIIAGSVVLARECDSRPFRASWLDWALVLGGACIVIVAFCWDCRNILAGGKPYVFQWPLFFVGEALGIAGFVRAWKRSPKAGT